MADKFAKLKGILTGVAPTALAALSGPYAPLVFGVIRAVMGKENASESDLEAAVLTAAGNPETVVKLKEIEAQIKAAEAELGVKFEALAVGDRQDARLLARETTLWPQIVLSGIFIVGYFTILGLFFSSTFQVPMSEAFMVMLGVLTAGVPAVMNFWLGSSSGSARKTDILAKNGH